MDDKNSLQQRRVEEMAVRKPTRSYSPPAASGTDGGGASADGEVIPAAVAPHWCKQLSTIKLTLVAVFAPIVFIPLPVVFPSPAGRCAYAILIMGVYWMTEVIPMAATALLPVVIFPWLGIMETKDVCPNYFTDAIMLFTGGMMVAVAIERWNLHKRIALRVLLLVGSKPPWLMFGFMITTAFLSMWISNTATTAMMIPIAQAVINELNNHRLTVGRKRSSSVVQAAVEETTSVGDEQNTTNHEVINMKTFDESSSSVTHHKNADIDVIGHVVTTKPAHAQSGTANGGTRVYPMQATSNAAVEMREQSKGNDDDDDDEWFETVSKGMRLSIAYAANIGGTATLTGTGTNVALKGQLETLYGSKTGVNFSTWFVFAFPNMLISLTLSWFWLMLVFIGPREIAKAFRRNDRSDHAKHDSATNVIREEANKLGKMSFAEAMVLVHFVVLALMWLTRDPEIVPGWGSLVPNGYVGDSCIAVTVAFMLFVVPSKFPNYLFFRRKTDTSPPEIAAPLLDWSTVHKKAPWNIMLLLGGGFALADGCQVSGLSQVIGDFLVRFEHFPGWALVLLLCVVMAAFTEVTSNVATLTIFVPILAELARSIHLNPLYLIIPVAISASFAFMLPVATPPNAIVFAYGSMKILDMMKSGIVMNVVCMLVLQLAINTWGYWYFGLATFPDWAARRVPGTQPNTTAFAAFNGP